MDLFHKSMSKRIGVGGWKCYCCEPSSKDRQSVRKFTRRKLKQLLRLERKNNHEGTN